VPEGGALRLHRVDEKERHAWIGLHALPGMGPKRLRRLRDATGSWLEALHALPRLGRELEPCWTGTTDVEGILRLGVEQQARGRELGAVFLGPGDEAYPRSFLDLEEPPPLVHLLGDPEALGTASVGGVLRVSVIGARGCTPYGRSQACRFAKHLAWRRATVVSGAARGIDLIALEAAAAEGGRTVAVLGSGLDHPYPSEAVPVLEAAMEQGGAVLSEFPFGVGPRPGHFPRRNRLIAALGAATLVVQATRKSGTMNTVAWCLDLGREVYALPGPVDDHACSGTNQLLSEGALVALSPADMVADIQRRQVEAEEGPGPAVLASLAAGDCTLEELVGRDLACREEVRARLLELELQGLVVRRQDGRYHRTGPS
jgi:DNA processing protein